MLIQGAVGVQLNGDGVNTTARMGKQGEVLMSELHGRYYEQTYRKNMYSACTQAVGTTTVGLATTYTGLVLSNPVGNAYNLVINKAAVNQSVIQATQPEAFLLAVGFNATTNVTHTAASTTLQSNFIGSGITPTGKVDTSATLPTAPTYFLPVHNTASATVLGTGQVIDLEGSLLLAPGAYVLWATPAQASVAGMWFSFSWEEVPV